MPLARSLLMIANKSRFSWGHLQRAWKRECTQTCSSFSMKAINRPIEAPQPDSAFCMRLARALPASSSPKMPITEPRNNTKPQQTKLHIISSDDFRADVLWLQPPAWPCHIESCTSNSEHRALQLPHLPRVFGQGKGFTHQRVCALPCTISS